MTRWHGVCAAEQIPLERGVCALVLGQQIAVFRTATSVHALSNQDPFSGAMVISRGIIGTHSDAPTVSSPMYKQVFDLRTGICLDQGEVRLATFQVRVRAGHVEVAVPELERQTA